MDPTTPFTPPTGARFYGYYMTFPDYANQAFAAESLILTNQNTNNAAIFTDRVNSWTQSAQFNQDHGLALPDKPIAPNAMTEKRYDLPNNGGTWIWQEEGAPIAVCPDLPPNPPAHINQIVMPANLPTVATVDKISSDTDLILHILATLSGDMQALKQKNGIAA
jgi:hypothetical protein